MSVARELTMQAQNRTLNHASIVLIVMSLSLWLTGCFPETAPPGSGHGDTSSAGTTSTDVPDAGDGGPSGLNGKCLPVTATS